MMMVKRGKEEQCAGVHVVVDRQTGVSYFTK